MQLTSLGQFDIPSMFEQSRSLISGAKIIIDSEGINDSGETKWPTTPVILSCSLAIEICIKILLINETRKAVVGHNIHDLFQKIGMATKESVTSHFLTQNPAYRESELLHQLSEHESIFVNWRYAYESQSDISCSPSFLFAFAYCLNTYIESKFKFERNQNGWLKSPIS
ncbi:hypothetical protein Q3O60_10840 [Alkalimonas collagenimarina]|uniref:HEPN domain-containing protein n=1 Tax=Alkalimonas collagenimarina TaxID=400390 RepID=A0ABT9H051_9GAMM|nr:hypothetical protein [Alkalimonas collagenimarina]MDP4536687.1 hypothetical protein [Alkalimonas collagenimarina]